MTDALTERGNLETDTHTGRTPHKHAPGRSLDQILPSQPCEGTNPPGTLISDFWLQKCEAILSVVSVTWFVALFTAGPAH